MVAEVFAGLSAFKTMFDTAKALKDMNDAVIRNAAVSDLWEQIFAAQTRYASAIEEIHNLEKKLAEFENWKAQKQRYELKDVGLGALAYVVKESMSDSEPPHQICAACYQHDKKSILQPDETVTEKILVCPECKSRLTVGHNSWGPTMA
jgi:hypothetical protein